MRESLAFLDQGVAGRMHLAVFFQQAVAVAEDKGFELADALPLPARNSFSSAVMSALP